MVYKVPVNFYSDLPMVSPAAAGIIGRFKEMLQYQG